MKSYLRFLSRNKLYTAIELAGLSISLAFVLLLANVVISDLSCDRMIRDKNNLYLCRTDDSPYFKPDPEVVFPQIADLTDWCNIAEHDAFDGKTQYIHTPDGKFRQDIEPLTVRKNYFDFFGLELASGDPEEVLEIRNAAVVSESLAAQIWQDTDPVGQTLLLTESRFKDLELVVTGVYKDYGKSTLPDNGLVVRYDYITEVENRPGALPSYMTGIIKPSSLHYVRLTEEADTEAIEGFLLKNNESDIMASHATYKEFELQPFKDLHYDERMMGRHNVRNIADKGIYSTFIFACLILLAFAGLNYISLTMAFSRFRVKEMATRQLLGTYRSGIISRCVVEAALLVTTSWFLAAALAFALQPQVSTLLETPIKLFSTADEWILAFALMAVITLAAGMIPAMAILRYKPMEVVKGEARHNDKVMIGKIFIGLQGALSIASVAITLAVYAQTSHMTDTPMGYKTEGLVNIYFGSYPEQKFEDELKSQSYVDTIGHISVAPTMEFGIMDHIAFKGGESIMIKGNGGDEAAFRLLGLEILEDYGTVTVNRLGQSRRSMLCESTVRQLESGIKGNQIMSAIPKQIDGVIRDFRMGNVKDTDHSAGYYFDIREPAKYDNLLVKVNCDVREAVRNIREFYAGMKPAEQQPKVDSLEELVENNYKDEQRILTMVGVFAILSILMTIMAIIALSSYHAQMQTKDVAIMKSFGCSRSKIFANMIWGFIWPVLAGCLAAIPATWAYIQHWLEKYPERTGNSPWIYLAAFASVILIVTAAISYQAVKLMNTNPASTLKKE